MKDTIERVLLSRMRCLAAILLRGVLIVWPRIRWIVWCVLLYTLVSVVATLPVNRYPKPLNKTATAITVNNNQRRGRLENFKHTLGVVCRAYMDRLMLCIGHGATLVFVPYRNGQLCARAFGAHVEHIRRFGVVLMPAQRPRRWAGIKATPGGRFAFAGIAIFSRDKLGIKWAPLVAYHLVRLSAYLPDTASSPFCPPASHARFLPSPL